MSSSPAGGTPAHGAAARVARNTAVRAVAELVGKLASLALIVVLAREEGPVGLGILVFALAWCELATTPIAMGFDRYLLRRVARDIGELEHWLFNVVALKLRRAVPVTAVSWILVWALGYDGATQAAVYLMTGSFLLDTLSYTIFSTFNGAERGDLVGVTLVTQRMISAGLGLTALLLGYGAVTVAGMFVVASTVALALALGLLAWQVHLPRPAFPREQREALRRHSIPFAAQELLSVGIARLDIVLLSTLATQAVVGYYGAAYRLLEATVFISGALQGAFAAMFTYLHERSDPTIKAVFQRSIKLSLTLLVPCAAVMVVLAAPILELLFGAGFESAVTAVRLLAPTVVLLGLVLLASSLISSRLDPRVLVTSFAVAFAGNVAVNVALIPVLGATGAALAMLLTELVLALLLLRVAIRAIGPLPVMATAAAPLVAGLAMAAAMAALQGALGIALAAGTLVYIAAFTLIERRVAPADFEFLLGVVRDRLPSSLAGRPSKQGRPML